MQLVGIILAYILTGILSFLVIDRFKPCTQDVPQLFIMITCIWPLIVAILIGAHACMFIQEFVEYNRKSKDLFKKEPQTLEGEYFNR